MRNIKELKLLDLLPPNICDANVVAAAEALDVELQSVTEDIAKVLILPMVNELPEAVIDLLAWQFHIDFYEPIGTPVAKKRELVKKAITWHRKKGTPAVVEEILGTIFGTTEVAEWWQYGGNPYGFKVRTETDDDINTKNLEIIRRAVKHTKNTRSWLEAVEFVLRLREDIKASEVSKFTLPIANFTDFVLRPGFRHCRKIAGYRDVTGDLDYSERATHNQKFLHHKDGQVWYRVAEPVELAQYLGRSADYVGSTYHDRRISYNNTLNHDTRPEHWLPHTYTAFGDEDKLTVPVGYRQTDTVRHFVRYGEGWLHRSLKHGPAAAHARMGQLDNALKIEDVVKSKEASLSTAHSFAIDNLTDHSRNHGPAGLEAYRRGISRGCSVERNRVNVRQGLFDYQGNTKRAQSWRHDSKINYGLLDKGQTSVASLAMVDSTRVKAQYDSVFWHTARGLRGTVRTPVSAIDHNDIDKMSIALLEKSKALEQVSKQVAAVQLTAKVGARSESRKHDGRVLHKATGIYSGAIIYNGTKSHSQMVDKSSSSIAVNINDLSCHRSYGGIFNAHNGGGNRWSHTGQLLRRKFASHGSAWQHDNQNRYLEGKARYGDLANMHDGIDSYGPPRLLHNCAARRLENTPTDGISLIVRRGYRRLAV